MFYKRVFMRKEKALIPSFGHKCRIRVGKERYFDQNIIKLGSGYSKLINLDFFKKIFE